MSEDRIDVRRGVPEDAPAIVRMARALNLGLGWPECRFTEEDYRRQGFGPDAAFHTFVAELDREVVGYAMYHRSYDTESASRGSYLSDLYVEEHARARGAGRALMRAVAKATAADGGDAVWWVTTKTNDVAAPFYRRIAKVDESIDVWVAAGDDFDALLGP